MRNSAFRTYLRSDIIFAVFESQGNWKQRISTFHNDMIEVTSACRFSTRIRHSNKIWICRRRWQVSCSVPSLYAHVVETCRWLCTIESRNRKRTIKIHSNKFFQIPIWLFFSSIYSIFAQSHFWAAKWNVFLEESPSASLFHKKHNIFSRSLILYVLPVSLRLSLAPSPSQSSQIAIQLLHITASLQRS